LESSPASECVTASGGDHDQESVRHGVRVDEKREYQRFCEVTPGREPVRTRKFSHQAPDIFGRR